MLDRPFLKEFEKNYLCDCPVKDEIQNENNNVGFMIGTYKPHEDQIWKQLLSESQYLFMKESKLIVLGVIWFDNTFAKISVPERLQYIKFMDSRINCDIYSIMIKQHRKNTIRDHAFSVISVPEIITPKTVIFWREHFRSMVGRSINNSKINMIIKTFKVDKDKIQWDLLFE